MKTARLIDVSHVIESGMMTYKVLPAPLICDYLSRSASTEHYAEGTSFHIGRVEMVANTGTYVDAPFHRYANGKDVSTLPWASLANLPGLAVHAPPDLHALGPTLFEGADLAGKAVLIHTDWDRHWRTNRYFEGHPFLTRDATELLRAAGAGLIGIDSLNIEDIADNRWPAHSILLGASIQIVEHLYNLGALPDSDFAFYAVPAKVSGLSSFPVLAFGVVIA